MVVKHEQIIRVWENEIATSWSNAFISHDVMFKSGLLTRESPYKSKQVDSEFVTILLN